MAGPSPTLEERWAESHAPLVERLRDEIVTGGPITFARFMEAALYDPSEGYYVRSDRRASRQGDFLSAPEQDPLFGGLLARQVEESWERLGRPGRFVLREDGAGSGALAASLLEALRTSAPRCYEACRYEPVEVDGGRAAAIRARLAGVGLDGAISGGTMTGDPGAPPGEGQSLDPGLVVANELLDALPVHRLTCGDGRLAEVFVDWSEGWFVERLGEPSDPRLGELLLAEGVRLAEGQRTEICLSALDWVTDLGAALRRGYAFVIDYGQPAGQRHAPSRPEGLLRTYRGQHAGDDAFRAVGVQDLTAHVDWTAIEDQATAAGLAIVGRTSLAAFCLGLDAGSLLTGIGARPETTVASYRSARGALRDLLDPRRLGAFGVLILGRDVPDGPPLRGLGATLPAAR